MIYQPRSSHLVGSASPVQDLEELDCLSSEQQTLTGAAGSRNGLEISQEIDLLYQFQATVMRKRSVVKRGRVGSGMYYGKDACGISRS